MRIRQILRGGLFGIGFFCGIVFTGSGAPRLPQPPWPEPTLRTYGFDSGFATVPWKDFAHNEESSVVESWSGTALVRDQFATLPVVIPLDLTAKRPNFKLDSGTIRFWFAPNWSTANVQTGGAGPGHVAHLLQLVSLNDENARGKWSLCVNATGDTIFLVADTATGPAVLLQAPIQWQAQDWRMITLNYSAINCALLVDNELVGSGAGLPAMAWWEQQNLGLVVGSDIYAGADNVAEGQFEELTLFGRWPKKSDWQDLYFLSGKRRSLLGPVGTKQEETGKIAALKMSGWLPEEYGVAKSSGKGDEPIILYSYAEGSLWLEIVGVTNAEANLIVHGTTPGQDYAIVSKLTLTNVGWSFETPVTGAAGQDWTPALVPVGERTNELFFWAISLGDADGDGIPDFWELEQSLNANNAADANADPDGDGYSNLDEFLLGQDPHAADPPAPTITINATDANAGEPNDSGTITLTRSGVTTRALKVFYTVYGTARGGIDYEAVGSEAVFPIGQSTASVIVQPMDDLSYEGNEDVTLQILPALHYRSASNALATVAIADNEKQPIRVWAMPEEITEGGVPGKFAFMREGDLRSALTVHFSLTGTATNGVAYQTLPLAITFATNEFLTNLTVMPINDTNYAGTRTAQLTITTNVSYQALTNVTSAALTIVDDEVPTVTVLADDADAREGNPVRNGRFKFLRNASVNEPLVVSFAVHGTARRGDDYQMLPTTFTIPAHTNAVYLPVQPIDDLYAEYCETVIVVLRGSRNYKIGAANSATVLIDDNEPVTYSWERTKATAVGGNAYLSNGEILVQRTGSTLTDVRPEITVTEPGGNQNIAQGFIWSGDAERVFEPGGPAGSSIIRAVFTNRRSEARVRWNRDFAWNVPVTLPGPRDFYIPAWFTTNFHTINFIEPDRLIAVNFLTNQVVEGSSATLRFTRPNPGFNQPPFPPATVFFTLGGVATLGADFTLAPLTNNSVTFGPGVYTVDVPLAASNDGVSEGWETVYVKLDPTNPDYSPDNRAGQNWMAAINIRDVSVTGPISPLDSDEDGMPDTYERTYGSDPFVFNDPYVDTDGDGIPNLEESLTGMNPTLKDTDNDALDDYIEWTFGSNPTNAAQNTLLPVSEYAAVKLVTASCYKCHQTTLNVGEYNLTSARPVRGAYSGDERREQIFQLLKGASYPVSISGPVVSDDEGSYTAEILAPTNGVPPEFFLLDPDGLLGVDRPVSELPGKTATLIVPKLELTWTNRGDNLALEAHTNVLTQETRGQRIFVGAKTPTETNPRNTVLLHIKTTPSLAGSNVWMIAYDVDDTTDDKAFDNDHIVDANGRAGNDNLPDFLMTPKPGRFVASGTAALFTNLNASGEAWAEFQVGMQPGNNYRVAATVFSASQLANLQSDTPTADGYVSAYTDWIRGGFNGALSPMLTVWRKLHLEIDSMTEPPPNGPQANFESGTIVLALPDKPNSGQSLVWLRANNSPLRRNQFENGKLQVVGYGQTYDILANQSELLRGADVAVFADFVVVQGSLSFSTNRPSFVLRDDDDFLLTERGLQNPQLPVLGRTPEIIANMTSIFAPAFIQLVSANASGFNPRTNLAFKLNEPPAHFPLQSYFADAKDVFDSPTFWAHTLVFGYQPDLSEDGDPISGEGMLIGGSPEVRFTNLPLGFSTVYVELVREDWSLSAIVRDDVPPFAESKRKYMERLSGAAAHEIAHGPGRGSESSDHSEGGLLDVGQIILQDFSVKTIVRFRKAPAWTD